MAPPATLPSLRSRPALLYLLRGVLGLAALVAAFDVAGSHPLVAIAFGAIALVSFRGCPMCWLIGWFDVFRRPGARTDCDNCSID